MDMHMRMHMHVAAPKTNQPRAIIELEHNYAHFICTLLMQPQPIKSYTCSTYLYSAKYLHYCP